jgi:hypothetical protein
MITIGRMAETYGLLPSEVASRATTYDLMVTDVLATYEKYTQQKSSGKLVDPAVYQLSADELTVMMEQARVKHN